MHFFLKIGQINLDGGHQKVHVVFRGGLELKFAIKARARPGLGPGSNFFEGPRPGPGPGSTFRARARPGLDILGLDPSLALPIHPQSSYINITKKNHCIYI